MYRVRSTPYHTSLSLCRQVPDLEVLGTQTTSGLFCSATPYAGYYLIVRSVQAADMTSTDPNPARIPVPSSGAPEVWGWVDIVRVQHQCRRQDRAVCSGLVADFHHSMQLASSLRTENLPGS
ncbi:hypothetical protein MHUMG1_00864 [Metarhizium humberi]|uniref:Uncharacterized protein n=1 Tax=Metarhizium humberi TaxID=2596975 RepID=A0A9P8MKH5_9HYPO|nr:hypothetical protein MHUMG1_00864 [Metarhizium humberi]